MINDNIISGLSDIATAAAGHAMNLRKEISEQINLKLQSLASEHGFVSRAEFEAVQAMASKAREENDNLKSRLEQLEKLLEKGSK